MLRLSNVILTKSIGRRLLPVAALFALLFTAISSAEFLFVKYRLYSVDESDALHQAVTDISRAVFTKNAWDLTRYRQTADVTSVNFIITCADGLLVDLNESDSAIVESMAPISPIPDGKPMVVSTELGERWQLIRTPLNGGSVTVGMLHPEIPRDANRLLRADLSKFGSSLATARLVTPGNVSNYIDGYVVLDSFGRPLNAFGALPVITKLNLPASSPIDQVFTTDLNGKSFAVLIHRVTSVSPNAFIVAYDDVSDQAGVLQIYKRFDIIIGAAAWVLVVLVILLLLLASELRRRKHDISVEEALRVGEGQEIEFKAGLLDRALAHAIVSFANTNAGNVFIGITDNHEVTGLEAQEPNARDQLLKKIRNIVSQNIRPAIFVRATFLEYHDKLILRIFVPRGNEPVYMVDGVAYVRQLSSVMKAGPQEIQAIIRSWHRGAA